ncbi:Slit 3 protein [Nymphon striatum]|nr:Slit 3 protein [Nymphon striatum]
MDVHATVQNLEGLESIHVEVKDSQLNDQLYPVYSSKLSDVKVTGRNIRSVSSSAFAGITNPDVKISLIDTGISKLPMEVFIPLPLSSKISMNISGSSITSLGHQLLNTLDSKQRRINLIGLDTNPVVCDCHLKPFWRWLQEKIRTGQFIDLSIQDITCYDPAPLRGQHINSLEETDLVCDPHANENEILVDPGDSSKSNSDKSAETGRASQSIKGLNKMDIMIIGIVAGVIVFVLILIIIICVLRLRRKKPEHMGGPVPGPYGMRTPHGYCTCVKPMGAHSGMGCTCCPPPPLQHQLPPRSSSTLPPKQKYHNPPPYYPPHHIATIPRGYPFPAPPYYGERDYKR